MTVKTGRGWVTNGVQVIGFLLATCPSVYYLVSRRLQVLTALLIRSHSHVFFYVNCISDIHGRSNFTDTNPLMSSLLVIFVWGGEAIL